MTKKAHALYDFDGQSGTGELTIRCGEVLTIIRKDVGEGWWEGTNSSGQSGLFPEAYVEELPSDTEDSGPPPMAPPPLPADYTGGMGGGLGSTNNGVSSSSSAAANNMGWNMAPPPANVQPQTTAATTAADDDDWGNSDWGLPTATTAASAAAAVASAPAAAASAGQSHGQTEYAQHQGYDDDWDSDFDDQPDPSSLMPPPAQPGAGGGGGMLSLPKNSNQSGSSGDVSSIGRNDSKKQGGTGKVSFNRFSVFVKSGGENYILGKVNANIQESDVLAVVEGGDGGFSWLNTTAPYSCSIASPKKESKMKGLKTFIAYQLTPSFNNIQVSRRYKHFDWLHERLAEKFSFIPVPPLPDKQIQGRYEEEFIEHRMNQLQSFVDRVCRHPVLSQSEVLQHFLTCTDDKRWKAGKRRAEKDALIGGSLFMAVRRPEKPMDQGNLEHSVHVFTTFQTQLDGAVKNMLKTCSDQTTKYQSHFKREYTTIGKSFMQLGSAMQQDGNTSSMNLTNAITVTGEAYEDIGKMFEDQPRHDWDRLGDVMHDYRGLLSGWPGILQVHSGALGKRKEFEGMLSQGKVGQAEVTEIGQRTDTLSYALLAEINTFHSQRLKDMKLVHQQFLQEQIKFYQKVTEKLQDALRQFDNC